MASIEAKPTYYKGILFASRLEARWAVYLDHHPLLSNWVYTPEQWQSPSGLYTPDYRITTHGAVNAHTLRTRNYEPFDIFLEIKPALPSAAYTRDLVNHILHQNAYLILCVGSFYQTQPVIYVMSDAPQVQGIQLLESFLGDNEAFRAASGYRFDLANPEGHKLVRPKKRRRRRR